MYQHLFLGFGKVGARRKRINISVSAARLIRIPSDEFRVNGTVQFRQVR